MSSRLKIVAGLAAIAVLALGWSAFAADDKNGGGDRDGRQQGQWEMPAPPPGAEGAPGGFHGPPPGGPGGPIGGPLGPEGGEVTNGELNVQRDGEAVTVLVDRGEVAAVDSDSITVSENDGNDVEIPVDEDTEVMAGPFEQDTPAVSDLEEGDQVVVSRDEGGAATKICLLPDGPPPGLEQDPEAAPGQSG